MPTTHPHLDGERIAAISGWKDLSEIPGASPHPRAARGTGEALPPGRGRKAAPLNSRSIRRCQESHRPSPNGADMLGKAGLAMTRFTFEDLLEIGDVPGSPASLHAKIGGMIYSSTAVRAELESLSAETGEYRVVLLGTLDQQPLKWDPADRPEEARLEGLEEIVGAIDADSHLELVET